MTSTTSTNTATITTTASTTTTTITSTTVTTTTSTMTSTTSSQNTCSAKMPERIGWCQRFCNNAAEECKPLCVERCSVGTCPCQPLPRKLASKQIQATTAAPTTGQLGERNGGVLLV